MHACDEKYNDTHCNGASASLPKVDAKLPSDYYAHANNYWIKDDAFEQSINWDDLTQEHMESLAADSYAYIAQTENIAQLTANYLSYIYSKWNSYEIYFAPNPELKRGFNKSSSSAPKINFTIQDYSSSPVISWAMYRSLTIRIWTRI